MRLTFTGRGAAYFPAFGNTSAYFWVGKRLVLLDCGELTFSAMLGSGALERCAGVSVLLTHFHADHTGSLATLISYARHVLQLEVSVYFPRGGLERFLDGFSLPRADYRPLSGPLVSPGGLRVEPVEVPHDPARPCYGYLLHAPGGDVFYSGDCAALPPDILRRLSGGGLAALYVDMTFPEPGSAFHGDLKTLCRLVPPGLRHRVYGMHFIRDFTGEAIRAGFRVAGGQEGPL